MTVAPRLSICIATYMRGSFIGETLRSLVAQLDARCELIIVDGASTDDTEEAVKPFAEQYPNIRYFREQTNSGVDRDYDKAVAYASGDYCWLMTDDDLVIPDAVSRVLRSFEGEPDLVVVNSQVRTADFSAELKPSLLPLQGRSFYSAAATNDFFLEMALYLSFIGSVVIRRTVWLARDRSEYYGSLFIHVGVIFQCPAIRSAVVVREPLIVIRYGNAMWTPRGFEIWMFKWPALIWSFDHIPAAARRAVSAVAPYHSFRRLIWFRAVGGYSIAEYERFLASRLGWPSRLIPLLVAWLPARAANALCGLYCWLRSPRSGRMAIYEMARSKEAAPLTVALARHRGIQ